MKITIIRHGQTNSNIEGRFLGKTDVDLNETGVLQAKKVAQYVKDEKFDAIYSSPLKRAVATAQEITKNHNKLSMKLSFGLAERNFGIWDDLTADEINTAYPDEYKEWQENWYTFKVPDGESATEAYERVSLAIDKILSQHKENEHILIVSHLGIIRYIVGSILGLGTEKSWSFFAENCSVSTIEIKNGHPVVTGLNIMMK